MTGINDYDFDLPVELIAQHPLPNRADARLLVVRREEQSLEHRFVRDLPELLRAGDVLVLNDSRVIPARLIGYRTQTKGKWEGLFLRSEPSGDWRLICKCRGKLRAGDSITLVDKEDREECRLALLESQAGGEWLARPLVDRPALDLLEQFGRVPLPCYIRGGEAEPTDRERYQTVYAASPGSVAAPTAGLHFTEPLLEQLRQSGIETARVTLHVGIGTFRPIEAQTLDDHVMHAEWGEVSAGAVTIINETRRRGRRVIAVGTTSMRLLETAAAGGELRPFRGETSLFIRPGHEFRAACGLLTNFHLPRSSLLVLVRTFGGADLIKRVYAEAIREAYRFYSYGDAMLIL